MATNEKEMRSMAKEVAEKPYVAELVGSEVYLISKDGKRRLSTSEKWCIDDIKEEEEDIIPLRVVHFLKKKVKIARFIDMIREEIITKLNSEKLSTNILVSYSTFFNLKKLKKAELTNRNWIMMVLIICMENEGLLFDMEEVNVEKIDKIYEELYLPTEADNIQIIRAVKNSVKLSK